MVHLSTVPLAKWKKMAVFISFLILVLSAIVLPHENDAVHSPKPHSVKLFNQHFSAVLHDNISNKKRQESGFNPLTFISNPNSNIYRDDAVGLNFEHIMNGAAKDADKCMFTPRKDSCFIRQYSDSSAAIIHKAKDSVWDIDSELKYTLNGPHYIDLEIKAVLRKDHFPLGYVGFMWASYMNSAVDRRIFFIGNENGKKEWIAFGEDTENGFEVGTVAYFECDSLQYEKETKTLNIIEDKHKKFVLPFYYGLTTCPGTEGKQDTMVYIMMFDQKEPIRFAMWNFFRNDKGEPDTHSPAWDWQYVIREPELNKEYGYKARVVYKPFCGREDVVEEFNTWIRQLDNL